MKRRFEYCDEKSNKFWEIEVIDKALTVTYGKIGTDGQSVTKKFKSADAALTEAEKQISEKTKKGYVEVISAPAGSKLRLTLETGAYFSNTSVYRKNKRSYFTVERRRTACSAIATEIRKPNSCTPVVISDVLFEGSSHKDAFFLTLSKGIDEKDKRRINKAFKADPDFRLEDYERKRSESWGEDTVHGNFKLSTVPETVVSFSCAQIQISVIAITEDQFHDARAGGLALTFVDDFVPYFEGVIFDDINFDIDGSGDAALATTRLSTIYKASLKKAIDGKAATGKLSDYSAFQVAHLKDARYTLAMYEEFDPTKLQISEIEIETVPGIKKPFVIFRLVYDGREFEFQEDSGGSVEYFVVDAKGKCHSVRVADDGEDGESEENYNSDDD